MLRNTHGHPAQANSHTTVTVGAGVPPVAAVVHTHPVQHHVHHVHQPAPVAVVTQHLTVPVVHAPAPASAVVYQNAALPPQGYYSNPHAPALMFNQHPAPGPAHALVHVHGHPPAHGHHPQAHHGHSHAPGMGGRF